MCIQLNLLLLPLGVWWQDRFTIFQCNRTMCKFPRSKKINSIARIINQCNSFRMENKKVLWSLFILARVHYAHIVPHCLIYRSRYNSLRFFFFRNRFHSFFILFFFFRTGAIISFSVLCALLFSILFFFYACL